MWGCLCVSGCKGHCPLHSFSSWDPSSSESQVFCTPSFIDLSLLVFWCTYIAKHFKRSLPSWFSNLVESMFLCIYKKIINDAHFSISFFMTIKKNWRPNCSNPFSLNIAEIIEHLNGEKKTIYWLHFLNLPPLKELQQIFVLYEAKVMIYWQKKWKKYKKLTPSLQFWMQTKILEVTHALPKYTVSYLYISSSFLQFLGSKFQWISSVLYSILHRLVTACFLMHIYRQTLQTIPSFLTF